MIKALLFATFLNGCSGNSSADETDAIKSLNEVENFEIFGNFITISSKNVTEPNLEEYDALEEYLRSHVIRIRAPFVQDKYINLELSDLIPNALVEGRKKRRTGLRDLLVPLLLALKYKSTVVLPLFMMLITFIAFKGFWAGITGMLISKLVALKVFLQSQEKSGDDHEEDQEDEGGDHNSDSPASFEISQDEEQNEHNEEPIVVFLNSDKHGGKLSRRRGRPHLLRRYYDPKSWDPWIGR